MLEACERNGTVLSVDHTRRFTPLWRYAKEQLLDKGEIGEVQWIFARLQVGTDAHCLPATADAAGSPLSGLVDCCTGLCKLPTLMDLICWLVMMRRAQGR